VYSWLVTLHLLGLAFFLVAHGTSMFVAFRIRKERDRAVIESLLGLSLNATRTMYVGLLVLGVFGLWAAATAGWLTATWVVASYITIVVVLLAMWSIASPYYMGLRRAIEGSEKEPRIGDEELVARLQSRRPEALSVVGVVGLVVLIVLMTVKPGA